MKRILCALVLLAAAAGIRAGPVMQTVSEAMEAAKRGDFARARALCQQEMAAEPNNPEHRYHFACIEAMIAAKEVDLAFTALDQAATLGYANLAVAKMDPDLAVLRGDARFAGFIARVERNAAAAKPVAEPERPAPSPLRSAAKKSAVAAEKPAPASFKSGVPVGLYFMTRYWSYTGTLEKAAWYFAPDGTVYEKLGRGFSAADLAEHSGRQGRAALAGGKVVVTWADGTKTESEVERDETGFMWDMGSFTPVQPITDREEVAGIYEGGESLSQSANKVAVSKRLELRADGTFRWEGVSFLSATSAMTQLSAGATGGSSGTWKAEAYSVTLTDENGRDYRALAFPYDSSDKPGPPSHLFFGGLLYKRQ